MKKQILLLLFLTPCIIHAQQTWNYKIVYNGFSNEYALLIFPERIYVGVDSSSNKASRWWPFVYEKMPREKQKFKNKEDCEKLLDELRAWDKLDSVRDAPRQLEIKANELWEELRRTRE